MAERHVSALREEIRQSEERLFTRHIENQALQVVFQSPTVARMAGVITEYQAKVLDEGRLDGIVAELESIADEAREES